MFGSRNRRLYPHCFFRGQRVNRKRGQALEPNGPAQSIIPSARFFLPNRMMSWWPTTQIHELAGTFLIQNTKQTVYKWRGSGKEKQRTQPSVTALRLKGGDMYKATPCMLKKPREHFFFRFLRFRFWRWNPESSKSNDPQLCLPTSYFLVSEV